MRGQLSLYVCEESAQISVMAAVRRSSNTPRRWAARRGDRRRRSRLPDGVCFINRGFCDGPRKRRKGNVDGRNWWGESDRFSAKIGEGGMGEVYRARDTKLDRDVALKVLPEAFTQDPERLARFEREAKVLASLNHQSSAYLARRTLSHARATDTLDVHLELLRCYYNFVRPHRALRFGRETRTPAMQAGLATRRLTLRDIFVSVRRVVLWLRDVRVFADSRRTAAAAVMYMPVAA